MRSRSNRHPERRKSGTVTLSIMGVPRPLSCSNQCIPRILESTSPLIQWTRWNARRGNSSVQASRPPDSIVPWPGCPASLRSCANRTGPIGASTVQRKGRSSLRAWEVGRTCHGDQGGRGVAEGDGPRSSRRWAVKAAGEHPRHELDTVVGHSRGRDDQASGGSVMAAASADPTRSPGRSRRDRFQAGQGRGANTPSRADRAACGIGMPLRPQAFRSSADPGHRHGTLQVTRRALVADRRQRHTRRPDWVPLALVSAQPGRQRPVAGDPRTRGRPSAPPGARLALQHPLHQHHQGQPAARRQSARHPLRRRCRTCRAQPSAPSPDLDP